MRDVIFKGVLFPGYKVSGDGEVFSFWEGGRDSFGRTVWKITNRSKQLRPWLTQGYPMVSIRVNSRTVKMGVHRLVAEAFIGPPPDGKEVCHWDGVKTNNNIANLRYDTRKGNLADRSRHGTDQVGERNPAAKLTNKDAEELKVLRANGKKLREIALRFNIAESTVSRIVNGVRRAKL